ncbi:MAG: SprT family zinc-dependent metalloprotease [Burkholderiaceae bacterium]|jgi:predicted metal-dependent hydrolase
MPPRRPKSKSPQEPLALQFELPLFFPEEPETRTETARKSRRILFGARVLEYQLRRSRRRSIGFAVDELGLTVTAPRWVTLAQIDEALREKERWIFAKIAEMQERRRAIPRVHWEDGGTLPYLGAPLTLCLADHAQRGEAVQYDASRRCLTVALPPLAGRQQLKDRVQGWLQAEARRIFAARLDFFAARLGVSQRSFRLSSAATRWGSCSSDGRILLNWRLVHFPMSSIDYVVAHELAHLKEMNHGPGFWKTVGQILPGFEAARAHLRDPPTELLPLL